MAADGQPERVDDGRVRLRYERRLAHPIDAVWAAITDPGELIEWWGDADVDLAAGRFKIRWLNVDEEGNGVEMDATVTEHDPPHVLEISGEPHGTLRFELARQPDGGTALTFTSTLALPDEYRSSVLAGWHYHLDALDAALNGERLELVELPNERFEKIRQGYES
jgi:uncharacterized protein YndB with AHSA1/START domain